MNSYWLNFIILVSLVAAFSSCRTEEQKLIDQIDGTWNLVDVNLTGPTTDNIDLPESGRIKFEKCKIGKNNVQFCGGSHQFNGSQSKFFEYQPGGSTDEKLIAFNILQSQSFNGIVFYLQGHYKILNMDKNNVTFEGNIYVVDDAGESKSYEATFILKKK